jgi:ribonuclease VapC
VIIDTSALVAILDQEPEAERIVRTLASAPERSLSAANLVETRIVMQARRGDDEARDLDLLLAKLRVDIAAVTASQADIARNAFRRYGRGRHPANLNFGDCFAYALAKDKSAPLLFKGNDSRQTDVVVASY